MTTAHVAKLAEGIDVAPIIAELEDWPGLWNAHPARREMSRDIHAQMSDIWVRYNHPANFDPANPAAFNDEHFPVNYPAWDALPSIHNVVFDLMAAVHAEHLGAILITRIPAGSGIAPHVDTGWHVGFYNCKAYLSLKSKIGADFVLDYADGRISINPKPGEVWRVDNRERHWVTNDSSSERMTMIICMRSAMFSGYEGESA